VRGYGHRLKLWGGSHVLSTWNSGTASIYSGVSLWIATDNVIPEASLMLEDGEASQIVNPNHATLTFIDFPRHRRM